MTNQKSIHHYILLGIITAYIMNWLIKYVETNFGEVYALVLACIFLLYILVFLFKPVHSFFSSKKYILRIYRNRKAIRSFPAMCKMYGFRIAWKDLFRKEERKPLFMRHELEGFLPDEETRKKSRKWSYEKLFRKVMKNK